MNFITFPAAATNLFPAANSTNGSQLVTEWNLRARETVSTDSDVVYPIGPSFTHGESDFEVRILTDEGGAYVNNYTLEIMEGRAVINGHYVETLVPMTIDLLEANGSLQSQARPLLKGDLAVGIRTFYSTEQTVAGSILTENEDDMYLGIQIVILPESELITPSKSPLDPNKVTADLKIATFTFVNNTITNLKNLKSKMQFLKSDRVADLDSWVSSRYVTKYGLNYKRIYTFAGKGANPATGYDTWEDSTGSLMIWDADPKRTLVKPSYKEAQFINSTDSSTYLVVPHQQVTGMTDDLGNDEYYETKYYKVPSADYNTSTGGVITKEYTEQIKTISQKVNQFRTTLTGKQIYFMDYRYLSDTDLPEINKAWDIGDYILVRNDEYYAEGSSDTESAPATKYVVLPGQVDTIGFVAQVPGTASDPAQIPENVLGCELAFIEWYESSGQDLPDTEHPEYFPQFYGVDDVVRGIPYDSENEKWYDYFRLRYYIEEDPDNTHPYIDFFYGVLTSKAREWSDAVVVTGSVAFAEEDVIGGFLNASLDDVDGGYVWLDDTGHLRLIDYEILRSGTLAYQIASDLTIPDAGDLDALQGYLDEYVNERVAFPTHADLTDVPPILNIYLKVPNTDAGGVLEIHGIDSRFDTAVCLHISGESISNVTINIRDCEKFIIASDITGDPVINVIRTCLYYDPVIFNYVKGITRDPSTYGTFTGFRDLSIWYAQRTPEDPALTVDGMTVSELDSHIISADINYWKELGTAANDNNYMVALNSITFSTEGDIVGCEVLAANNSTDNVDPGDKMIVGYFVLPQGASLSYPIACLTRTLKITGTFTSAYYSDENWYVTDTSFTMETDIFDPYSTATQMTGEVAFHSKTSLIPSTISQTSIKPWEPDTYHLFRGGAIS